MGKKVTFTLSAETVGDATSALLLGEFNNWNSDDAIILKKQKDGSMKATTTLEEGRTYQYRYLLSDGRWVNDHRADDYVPVNGYHVENCVISVPVEEEKKAAKAEKAPKAKKASAKTEKIVTADDLTKIEGIGKKIAELLQAEKILTFKDLSKASAKKLKGILEAAGNKFQMHDPASWPKQAKLAAAEKWEELEALQKELAAGK
ncbi:glycoside hydrolase family 13 [Terrimonas pollutisoli]|uniref:glycoside hydrolase family 13 n=1 Tax=Terrimonas pollutisoli TaxID=3034147 RepID=UPI0023ECDC61|nr:glycoside hydrolase family 13 [Terrimonas sp. H1YJ31]